MDIRQRNNRIRKALHEVAPHYTITAKGPNDLGHLRFVVTGGATPYYVVVDPGWATRALCSCPDHTRDRSQGGCKHIVAVLTADPALQCQCLDLFL